MSVISQIKIKDKAQQEKDEAEKKRKQPQTNIEISQTPQIPQPPNQDNTDPRIPQVNPNMPAVEATQQQITPPNLRALIPQQKEITSASFYTNYSKSQKVEMIKTMDNLIVFVFCFIGLLLFYKFLW